MRFSVLQWKKYGDVNFCIIIKFVKKNYEKNNPNLTYLLAH